MVPWSGHYSRGARGFISTLIFTPIHPISGFCLKEQEKRDVKINPGRSGGEGGEEEEGLLVTEVTHGTRKHQMSFIRYDGWWKY